MYNFVKEGVMFTKEESESNRKKERYYSIIEGIGNNFLNDNFNEAITFTFFFSKHNTFFYKIIHSTSINIR